MLWSRFVIGYHGCSEGLAHDVVCKNTMLVPSQNDYDWLGHGIYFWEGSSQRALDWAAKTCHASGGQPAVLGAVIDLGSCLNLVETEHLEIVREAYLAMELVFSRLGTDLPQNTGPGMKARRLDCAVFQLLHEIRERQGKPEFDTVRAFFAEGKELYPGAGINHMDHIQICVRHPKQIVGYFLPQEDFPASAPHPK